MPRNIPGAPEKYPLKNLANFSSTIERYDIKLYTMVTHLDVCERGNFHYIHYIQNYAAFSHGNLAVNNRRVQYGESVRRCKSAYVHALLCFILKLLLGIYIWITYSVIRNDYILSQNDLQQG